MHPAKIEARRTFLEGESLSETERTHTLTRMVVSLRLLTSIGRVLVIEWPELCEFCTGHRSLIILNVDGVVFFPAPVEGSVDEVFTLPSETVNHKKHALPVLTHLQQQLTETHEHVYLNHSKSQLSLQL